MKIAYLTQQSGIRLDDNRGGIVHVREVIRALQKLDHEVIYTTLDGQQVLLSTDLLASSSISLGLTGSLIFRLFESGVRRIQSELTLPYLAMFDSLRFADGCIRHHTNSDVFYERFSMLGLGGTLAASRLHKPLILEVNADFLDELDSIGEGPRGLQRRAVQWASRICFQRATAVVAVSSQLKAHLIDAWMIPPAKIRVLPNGVDTRRFFPEIDPPAMRRKLGLIEVPSIIFVGGFFPWHVPLELIRSFSVVQTEIPNARLYMVGDGPLRDQAKRFVRETNLEEAVVFVGSVKHVEVPNWLAAMDVAVAPFSEFTGGKGGSPLKLFEYMAAGKAIVATATGQVNEIIWSGSNGLLVPVGDVHAFGEAIACLLKDPAMRKALAHRARNDAEVKHTWLQYAQRLTEIYESVI